VPVCVCVYACVWSWLGFELWKRTRVKSPLEARVIHYTTRGKKTRQDKRARPCVYLEFDSVFSARERASARTSERMSFLAQFCWCFNWQVISKAHFSRYTPHAVRSSLFMRYLQGKWPFWHLESLIPLFLLTVRCLSVASAGKPHQVRIIDSVLELFCVIFIHRTLCKLTVCMCVTAHKVIVIFSHLTDWH